MRLFVRTWPEFFGVWGHYSRLHLYLHSLTRILAYACNKCFYRLIKKEMARFLVLFFFSSRSIVLAVHVWVYDFFRPYVIYSLQSKLTENIEKRLNAIFFFAYDKVVFWLQSTEFNGMRTKKIAKKLCIWETVSMVELIVKTFSFAFLLTDMRICVLQTNKSLEMQSKKLQRNCSINFWPLFCRKKVKSSLF